MNRLRSGAVILAAAASALLAGCGPMSSGACNPGEPGCTAVLGTALAGDPRFVGPGMLGPALPHWPMFRHDATHSGRNGVAPPPSGFVAWTALAGGPIWSSPAIGIDGTVYVGSLDGKLYAFSREGRPLWTFETFANVFSSPAVAGDGTAIVGSVDGHVYAVKNGQLKWSVPVHNCAFSSPVLAHDGTIYLGTNARQVHAISSEGRILWSFTARLGFSSTPAILPSGEVMAGNDDGTIYVFQHGKEKKLLGQVEMGVNIRATPVAVNGVLYVMTENKLYAIENKRN